jgi:microcystin-dependent protein
VAGVPTGYLACNGNAVSRSVYAGLFSKIGTNFGAGDGTVLKFTESFSIIAVSGTTVTATFDNNEDFYGNPVLIPGSVFTVSGASPSTFNGVPVTVTFTSGTDEVTGTCPTGYDGTTLTTSATMTAVNSNPTTFNVPNLTGITTAVGPGTQPVYYMIKSS